MALVCRRPFSHPTACILLKGENKIPHVGEWPALTMDG